MKFRAMNGLDVSFLSFFALTFLTISLGIHFHLWRHSPRALGAGITNRLDHVANGRAPGSKVLCELIRDFHSVLSSLCVAEDSRSGEGLQVCLGRGCPPLQLASSSPAPRARRCGLNDIIDQFTVGTSCSVPDPRALFVRAWPVYL